MTPKPMPVADWTKAPAKTINARTSTGMDWSSRAAGQDGGASTFNDVSANDGWRVKPRGTSKRDGYSAPGSMPFFFITSAAFDEVRNFISAAAAAGSLAWGAIPVAQLNRL